MSHIYMYVRKLLYMCIIMCNAEHIVHIYLSIIPNSHGLLSETEHYVNIGK